MSSNRMFIILFTLIPIIAGNPPQQRPTMVLIVPAAPPLPPPPPKQVPLYVIPPPVIPPLVMQPTGAVQNIMMIPNKPLTIQVPAPAAPPATIIRKQGGIPVIHTE